MNIALDYDGTYTSDPSLWLRFVLDAQASGTPCMWSRCVTPVRSLVASRPWTRA